MSALERLIVEPVEAYPGTFKATLESTSQVIVQRSRQPMVDSARKLLELDFCPSGQLTMRVLGKTYDSFVPQAIGELAKWSFTEGERTILQRQKWKPREACTYARTEAPAEAV